MRPALEEGGLPTLSRLVEQGRVDWNCVSVFPSITPAATASIVTGRYPRDHGIAGMSWWNPATDDVAYYGDDVGTVLMRGAGDFVRDFLLQLNDERLRVPTLFQIVERQGLRAGCINHLIFRGDVAHEVDVPLLMRLWPSIPSSLEVQGPSMLVLGDFIAKAGPKRTLDAVGGIFHRFGLDDAGTAGFLREFSGPEALQHFTVAYFPDYDFESHDNGPEQGMSTLRAFDERLGHLFEAWGGVDRVLEELCVMLTADHSHSNVRPHGSGAIALDELLGDFSKADPASGWTDEHQLMICPNMRAAEILLRGPRPGTIERVSAALLEDERVDQVITQAPNGAGPEFSVATRNRGQLGFGAAETGHAAVTDEFGGSWRVSGDLAAVAGSLDGKRLVYSDYPNALERIAGGLDHPRGGRLWVTAHPGYEFATTGQSVHFRAGSHGTLHALDSLVPLLVSGTPEHLALPHPSRIVDVASLCLSVLGLPDV